MKRIVPLFAWTIAAQAHALDIPMQPHLAEAYIDSKTCYGTLTIGGRLAGYELADLLVSNGGRLLRLAPAGASDIGDGKRRTYSAEGIAVVLVPRGTRKDPGATEDFYTIREQVDVTVIRGDKRERLKGTVVMPCSP
jgi:hypothetical protein